MDLPLIVCLAFSLSHTDPDWPKAVKHCEESFATWQADHESGDMADF